MLDIVVTLFITIVLLSIVTKINSQTRLQKQRKESFLKILNKLETYLLDEETVKTHWPLYAIIEFCSVNDITLTDKEKETYKRVMRLASKKVNCEVLVEKDPIRHSYVVRFNDALERVNERLELCLN